MLGVALAVAGCPCQPPATPAVDGGSVPAGQGAVLGVAVAARPGFAAREPAPGAEATLLGSSLRAVADQEGRFRLDGVADARAELLLRHQPSGRAPLLRRLPLAAVGAGPGVEVSLGQVALLETARVVGRLRRADVAGPGGHGGIDVYVPEAPWATRTVDDGSFVLEGLPAGAVVLSLRADGYVPASLDGIELRGGEELTLAERPLRRQVDTPPPSGGVRGAVVFAEPADVAPAATVTVVSAVGAAGTATAAPRDDGAIEFTAGDLPAGLYTVIVSAERRASAVVPNVPITGGEVTALSSTVVLGAAPASAPACSPGAPCAPLDPCREGMTRCVAEIAICEQQPDRREPGSACGEHRVCGADGVCRACRPGASCTPENPCHAGTMSCSSGEPACADSGSPVAAGTPCGEGFVCGPDGRCVACQAGQLCDAGNCRLGSVVCTEGAPECRSLELLAPAGRACGEDKVCSPEGVCLGCTADEECTPANRCRKGRRACDTGTPRCLETEEFLPAGVVCATDRVCDGVGGCVPCAAGAACVPENPCHAGSLSCSTGAPVCADTGQPGTVGASCASGRVCNASGECVPCALGALCTAAPCRLGAIECATGEPVCAANGLLATSGEACGEGRVCDPSGNCNACVPGGGCTPANVCRKGAVSCATGLARCVEAEEFVTAGTACAAGRVCDGLGACVPCDDGAACAPEDPCHAGALSCSTGAPVCVDTGLPGSAGTACGTGKVCSAAGECVACAAGSACTASACRLGVVECGTGAPVCAPTGLFSPSGEACGTGRVCDPAGNCNACTAGASCVPANVCRKGTTSCATGSPRCVESDEFTAAGTTCAAGRVCDGLGACVPCVAGGACTPADPCHTGVLSCSTGAPVCTDTGQPGLSGTPCAQGKVCNAQGACVACALGTLCQAAPCRLGTIACDTGAPVCVENGLLALSGEGCGEGKVCDPSGNCGACAAGASCVPPNSCWHGQVSCATGTARCVETGVATAAGTACGTGRVCDGLGGCVPCVSGGDCAVAGSPCAVGAVSCATGRPTCLATGTDRPAGYGCSAGSVCDASAQCVLCDSGAACVPAAAPCKAGRIGCATGAAVCAETSAYATPGTSCGTGRVCSRTGTCVDCAAGVACTPADPCRRGAVSCATGESVCEDSGAAQPAGTACGTDRVCNAAGQCVACADGAACTPANPCVTGTVGCATGVPVCAATATQVADGTTCGTDKVCRAGTCVDCAAGGACTPAGVCRAGTVSCATGAAVCQDTGAAPDGAPCGPSMACRSGACVASGLVVVSGDGQGTSPGWAAGSPVVLELRDAAGAPVSGATVSLQVPPGSWTSGTALTTGPDGRVSFYWTLGYALGTHTVIATAPGARAVVTAHVAPEPEGVVRTIVNQPHASTVDLESGPATQATLARPVALQLASDGSFYVLDRGGVVRKVDPAGHSTLVAGGAVAAAPAYGDDGPALQAQFDNPSGLALDEAHGALLVADTGHRRIRRIDLATGTIRAFAGNGTLDDPPGPGNGDGGPASAASLTPGWMAMGPQGKLFFTDVAHGRPRVVYPDSAIVDKYVVRPTPEAMPGGDILFEDCPEAFSCQMAFDAEGGLFLAARFAFPGGTPFLAIARLDAQKNATFVAGSALAGKTVDRSVGTFVSLGGPPSLALDAAGNLFFADPVLHRVRRIDRATRATWLVGGNGSGGFSGDGFQFVTAAVKEPGDLVFDAAGNGLLADSGNATVRRVQGLARTTIGSLRLRASAGGEQSVPVAHGGSALALEVADETGGALPGSEVRWRAVDPGGAVYSTRSTADLLGIARTDVRAGLVPGTYRFEATVLDLLGHPPPAGGVVFTVTATAPPAGSFFAAVNAARGAGAPQPGRPVAATIAETGELHGVAVAADGTLLVADAERHSVYSVTAAGLLSVLAGTPGSEGGFAGDGGVGGAVRLHSPADVGVRADGAVAYIADTGNNRIRGVDGASGIVWTLAGGGTQTAYPFGDGGPAASARLHAPARLVVGPDGALYFRDAPDGGAPRVRRVDPAAGTIAEYWRPAASACIAGQRVASDCGTDGDGACSLAFDAQGNAYLATRVCDRRADPAAPPGFGIVRRTPAGVETVWAGTHGGPTAAAAPLDQIAFQHPPFVTFDAAGNAYLVEREGHRIRRYEAATGWVSPWLGDGTAGWGAEAGDRSAARLDRPGRVAVDAAGHVYVPDSANRTLRVVW